MTAKLEIEENPEGLVIRSVRNGSVPYALLSAALTGIVVFVLGRLYFHRPALIVITAVAAAWASSRWWRAVRGEVRITRLEMQVLSGSVVGSRFDRCIPLADIRRMEFRPNHREDGFDRPDGLYVVQKWKADCVLPRLSEEQTQKAIDAIYQHLPIVPILPERGERDMLGRDLALLNPNSREKADSRANS